MVDGVTNNSETASVQLLPQCQGFKSPMVIGDYTQWSIEDVSCFPFDLLSWVIHRTGFPALPNSRLQTTLTLRVALNFLLELMRSIFQSSVVGCYLYCATSSTCSTHNAGLIIISGKIMRLSRTKHWFGTVVTIHPFSLDSRKSEY